MKCRIVALLAAVMLLGGVWGEEAPAEPTVGVSNVVFRQRYPWNGFVDIECDVGCSDAETNLYLTVSARDNTVGKSLAASHVWLESDATHTNALKVKVGHHRLVWDAGADNPNVVSTNVTIEVLASVWVGGVQLWENGPYWAECNVGATKPEEYGYYFWWGDTVGYKRNAADDDWVSVMDGTGFLFDYSGNCPTYGKNNSQLQSAGYINSTGNLVAAHDAATAHLGAPWRMPTDAELAALISNCTTTWITTNGVYGRLVTGKGMYASKSIFLPAAGYGYDSDHYDAGSYGYYWPSTPVSDSCYNAWGLGFYSSNFDWGYYLRYVGLSVRPLRGFAK